VNKITAVSVAEETDVTGEADHTNLHLPPERAPAAF